MFIFKNIYIVHIGIVTALLFKIMLYTIIKIKSISTQLKYFHNIIISLINTRAAVPNIQCHEL